MSKTTDAAIDKANEEPKRCDGCQRREGPDVTLGTYKNYMLCGWCMDAQRKSDVVREAKRLVDELDNFVNHANREDIQVFAEHVAFMHRTLQQKLFGLFLECCLVWSESRYDARNEWTVCSSKKILEVLEYKAGDRPPYV